MDLQLNMIFLKNSGSVNNLRLIFIFWCLLRAENVSRVSRLFNHFDRSRQHSCWQAIYSSKLYQEFMHSCIVSADWFCLKTQIVLEVRVSF